MKWYIDKILSRIEGERTKRLVKKTLEDMKHPADLVFWGMMFGDNHCKGYSDLTEAQKIFKEGFEAGIWWNDNAPRD